MATLSSGATRSLARGTRALRGGASRRRARPTPTPTRHRRRGTPAMAFLPNLIPNPNYRWGDDENPSGPPRGGTVDEVLFAHDKWRVGHEHGVDDHDVIYRSFRCRDAKTGHALLESLQDALYSDNERGCRIRRETQGMFYMCCDGVRVRLNEPKHEVLVEVPMPAETNAQLAECRKTLGTVETVAKKHHSR